MALDFPSSPPADPQRDEADKIITNTTTNSNWPLGIPTITLSPSPDPQRMPPPPPPSSSQDNFDYDSDSSTSKSGVVQTYGFKSKTTTGGDVAAVGVNGQEREIRTKNDLHPYVQTLSLADLESCVALENAAFPEEERCSREKVREPTLCLFFNSLLCLSVSDFPLFFFFFWKGRNLCFFSSKPMSLSSSTISTCIHCIYNRNIKKTFPPALFRFV